MTAKHYGTNADSVFRRTTPTDTPDTTAPTPAKEPTPKAATKPRTARTPAKGTDTPPTDERAATGTERAKLGDWDKFTVILERSQVAFLDDTALSLRRRGLTGMNRAKILRELVSQLERGEITLPW